MSTRTTPYGLNAAVSLARWGGHTDLELEGREEVRIRIDMGVVDALIRQLESRLEIVRELWMETHPLVSIRAGRAFLPERFAGEGSAVEVSVRATRPVVKALELAGNGPTPFANLAQGIGMEFPATGAVRIEGLVHDLIRQGLLLTELRPPLTRGDPARHLLAVLERIGAASDERERLAAAVSACERWQQLGCQEGAEELCVLDSARAVSPSPVDGCARPGRHEAPGVARDRVIPVKELVVGVRDGTFYLRWPRGGAYVQVAEGHMLNPKAAPAVGAFLSLMRHAGRPVVTGFTWGSARELPMLPRVEAGRIVLSPATWHPPFGEGGLEAASRERFEAALQSWRAEWEMPRWVFAGQGDHRLLIDLDDADQVELLRGLVRSRHGDATLVLHEALPGVGSAWLPGPGGGFLVELAVPLARRSAPRDGSQRANARPPAGLAPQPSAVRTRAPGSDWLYAKLYAGGAVAEQLVGRGLSGFASDVLAAGLADDWFFVRYRDPRPHVRVRFRGDPERLTGELTARLCAWVAELIYQGACQSLVLDTYERELERYGGELGMETAEAVFGVDSRAACDLIGLHLSGRIHAERERLCVLTLDRLLEGLGLDFAARRRWCSARESLRHAVSSEWRDDKDLLRSLFGSGGGGEELVQLLDRFVIDLRPHGDRLTTLCDSGQIQWPSADDMYASFAHMHCNRLLGVDRGAERRTLGLLHRTLDSLSRAPVE